MLYNIAYILLKRDILMSKVMFSLPDELVFRMKSVIPAGERSEVLANLLDKEIKAREDNLYNRAAELEACVGLRREMAEWDAGFSQDGLDDV